jgi:hypothetical protein
MLTSTRRGIFQHDSIGRKDGVATWASAVVAAYDASTLWLVGLPFSAHASSIYLGTSQYCMLVFRIKARIPVGSNIFK